MRNAIFSTQRRGDAPVPGSSGGVASNSRNKVFVSYSHHDQRWLERLLVHLKPLEREGRTEVWSDLRLIPGVPWRKEIRRAIDQSKAAVLLVSADFMASDFITSNELPPLLRAAETRGVRILCLIISDSNFHETALARFHTINPPSTPLGSMPRAKRERYFHLAYAAVRDAVS
jgi:hypothetical protein